ncbi:unnamed protein product [Callosobruchus maculatus]|uniref:C2H2-type domain-containing protein n=1 Tax=Callosobruchus maculatus TaxID=64391 RepID=A0A653DLP9_CALMS|nr:unnamed protein product [Callosobruchus maculatus]
MYMHKRSLARHQKFECNQEPKFFCPHEGCDYRAHQKMTASAGIVISAIKHINTEPIGPGIGNMSVEGNHSLQSFLCIKCFRTYSHKRSLKRHLKFECGKEAVFDCPIEKCSYKAKLKENLTKHMKRHHPDEYTDISDKKALVQSMYVTH